MRSPPAGTSTISAWWKSPTTSAASRSMSPERKMSRRAPANPSPQRTPRYREERHRESSKNQAQQKDEPWIFHDSFSSSKIPKILRHPERRRTSADGGILRAAYICSIYMLHIYERDKTHSAPDPSSRW